MKINPYQNNANVNAYAKSASVSNGQTASSTNTKDPAVSNKRDQVTISSEAKQLNESNRIQTERQQKVDALKTQVQNGQYTMQPQAVAEAFATYWQALGGGGK